LDLIPAEKLQSAVVFEDCMSAGYAGERRARWFNVHVKRSGINASIAYANRISGARF